MINLRTYDFKKIEPICLVLVAALIVKLLAVIFSKRYANTDNHFDVIEATYLWLAEVNQLRMLGFRLSQLEEQLDIDLFLTTQIPLSFGHRLQQILNPKYHPNTAVTIYKVN